MKYLLSFLALGLFLVSCTDSSTLSIPDEPVFVTVPNYSEAQELRDSYAPDAEIEAVCDRADEDRCVWGFEAPREIPVPPSLLGEKCQSYGGFIYGGTACQEYSDAKRERDAMVADGWICSGIEFNNEIGEWVFLWMAFPDDGSGEATIAPRFSASHEACGGESTACDVMGCEWVDRYPLTNGGYWYCNNNDASRVCSSRQATACVGEGIGVEEDCPWWGFGVCEIHYVAFPEAS